MKRHAMRLVEYCFHTVFSVRVPNEFLFVHCFDFFDFFAMAIVAHFFSLFPLNSLTYEVAWDLAFGTSTLACSREYGVRFEW